MSRECRRVPKDWEHPKSPMGHYRPLRDSYEAAFARFQDLVAEKGLRDALNWDGGGPVRDDYLPDWPPEERTHYQMYETCTEGTPISPVMPTPESLAEWLSENNASALGNSTASYDAWLRMIKRGGESVSAVWDQDGFRSGVEAGI